jgi:hypothetical protein
MNVVVSPQGQDAETVRRTLQDCLDRVAGGADYKLYGPILFRVGTMWLARSPQHDIRIF